MAYPTAMVNDANNPVKCTPCPNRTCPSDFDKDSTGIAYLLKESFLHIHDTIHTNTVSEATVSHSKNEFDFNVDWVDAYCVINEMTIVIQYFPHLILLMAMALVVVQKITVK